MPRTKNPNTSERRRKIILFIHEFKANRDYSPNIREIAEAIGDKVGSLSTSVVTYYLRELQKEGCLGFNSHEARTLRLTKEGKKYVKELLSVKGRTASKNIVDEFTSPAHLPIETR